MFLVEMTFLLLMTQGQLCFPYSYFDFPSGSLLDNAEEDSSGGTGSTMRLSWMENTREPGGDLLPGNPTSVVDALSRMLAGMAMVMGD